MYLLHEQMIWMMWLLSPPVVELCTEAMIAKYLVPVAASNSHSMRNPGTSVAYNTSSAGEYPRRERRES